MPSPIPSTKNVLQKRSQNRKQKIWRLVRAKNSKKQLHPSSSCSLSSAQTVSVGLIEMLPTYLLLNKFIQLCSVQFSDLRKSWSSSMGGDSRSKGRGFTSQRRILDGLLGISVTRKKSPNVYKSCPIMISLEK